MKKSQKTIFFIIIIVLVLGALSSVLLAKGGTKSPGKYDELATCIKNSGATFYGAFWCPHCQKTKKDFGSSAKLLPYVECSTPDGSGQLPICADKKIEGYPTWIFADGSKLTGEVPLQTLADKTSCVLPK